MSQKLRVWQQESNNMTLKQEVLKMLESYEPSRERVNRARSVWYILSNRTHKEILTKEDFLKHFKDIQSINRIILWHQQHNPNLRGKDYGDKDVLEQETMMDLGYEPGHNYYDKKLKDYGRE